MTPSVTQVLAPFSDFSMIRPDVLDAAAERGSRLHSLFAAYALGVWVPSIQKNEDGYFESFQKWFDRHVIKIIAIEQRRSSESFNYHGTADLVCMISIPPVVDALAVVDFKTPITESRTWRPQVAAYAHLWGASFGGALMIDPDGRPAKMIWADCQKDFAAFISALNCYRYFIQEK